MQRRHTLVSLAMELYLGNAVVRLLRDYTHTHTHIGTPRLIGLLSYEDEQPNRMCDATGKKAVHKTHTVAMGWVEC